MNIPGGISAMTQQAPERMHRAGGGEQGERIPGRSDPGQSGDIARDRHAFEQALHQGAPGRDPGVAASGQDGAGQQARPQVQRTTPQGSGPESAQSAGQPDATGPDATGPDAAGKQAASHGDRILAAMEKGRAEYRTTIKGVDQSAEAAQQMSPAELIRMQLQVARVTLNESLAGQVGSKVDSDVQTLLKD